MTTSQTDETFVPHVFTSESGTQWVAVEPSYKIHEDCLLDCTLFYAPDGGSIEAVIMTVREGRSVRFECYVPVGQTRPAALKELSLLTIGLLQHQGHLKDWVNAPVYKVDDCRPANLWSYIVVLDNANPQVFLYDGEGEYGTEPPLSSAADVMMMVEQTEALHVEVDDVDEELFCQLRDSGRVLLWDLMGFDEVVSTS